MGGIKVSITKVKKGEQLKQLSRQTELFRDNCITCPNMNAHTVTVCAGCLIFVELVNIGNWLLSDSAAKKGRAVEVAKPGPRLTSRTMTNDKLSIIAYTNLRSEGMSDKKIVEDLAVSLSSFRIWKQKNGLIGKGI